jgi:diguanylate cyclase (GGDEF)-like protein
MDLRRIALALIAAGIAAAWPAVMGAWPTAVLAALAAAAGAWSLVPQRAAARAPSQTTMLAASPGMLDRRRNEMRQELGQLEEAQELQRGVFEVSSELVGCVEEADARARFGAAMRRYWACDSADLMVWERGTWRSLGGPATGEPPELGALIALPEENHGDLVLDLSPAVDGQAALVLRHARVQPSLNGRSDEAQRHVADVLRSQLSLSLRRVMLYNELQALARMDPLTGTHRRWYAESRLRELVDTGEVLSVAMVDIDLFKKVNDAHGHAAGDQVLAGVGRSLVAQLRTNDLVSRFGGEEFLVILPETNPEGALLVAERLRSAVAALANLPVTVTVSVGLASCCQDEHADELVARADRALYQAKERGRNRVVVADETSEGAIIRTTARKNRTSTGALVRKSDSFRKA